MLRRSIRPRQAQDLRGIILGATPKIKIALLLLTMVGLAIRLFAQATEGTILGTVVDSSGAAVVNATVTVSSVQTGAKRTTNTAETGDYVDAHC